MDAFLINFKVFNISVFIYKNLHNVFTRPLQLTSEKLKRKWYEFQCAYIAVAESFYTSKINSFINFFLSTIGYENVAYSDILAIILICPTA